MKLYATSLLACCLATTLSAQTPLGEGTRVDYLDGQGKRTAAQIIGVDSGSLFNVYGSSGEFSVIGPRFYDKFLEMKFIPWGTESYTASFVANENVKVTVTAENTEGTRSNDSSRVNDITLKCGTPFRIYIEVPEGAYPTLELLKEYTGVVVYEEGEKTEYPYSLDSYPYHTMFWQSMGTSLTDPQWRQGLLDMINGKSGLIRRSEDNPDLWYVDWVMENQPVSFTADYVKLDGHILDNYVDAAMYSLYSQGADYMQNNNIEGFIQSMYGELLSQDQITNLQVGYAGSDLAHVLQNAAYNYNAMGWVNYMGAVTIANYTLKLLPMFTFATQEEKDVAEAKLLVLRSHAYWRLLQMYAPRWEDSANGSALCAPLETEFSADTPQIVTMREILDRCYADLDKAIQVLPGNESRRSILDPTADVARGVKLRLAMLSHDWQQVVSLSEQILPNYNISTNEEYLSGFFYPTSGWIWGAWNNSPNPEVPSQLVFWSWQATAACNGSYPAFWQIGPGAIDKKLYDSLDDNDIRKSLYVMEIGRSPYNAESMFKSKNYSDVSKLFLNDTPAQFCRRFSVTGLSGEVLTAFRNGNDMDVPVPFGAQHKFYGPDYPGYDAAIPLMRVEEILLSRAEAAYHLGNQYTASSSLDQLNSVRIPGYNVTAYNNCLLEEIYKTRRIELWGEGFSWFDFKRWNKSINRTPWVENDNQSGNWPSCLENELKLDSSDLNGWRCLIPAYYVRQNPNVDVSAFGYSQAEGYTTPSESPKKVAHKKSGKSEDLKTLSSPSPLKLMIIE